MKIIVKDAKPTIAKEDEIYIGDWVGPRVGERVGVKVGLKIGKKGVFEWEEFEQQMQIVSERRSDCQLRTKYKSHSQAEPWAK